DGLAAVLALGQEQRPDQVVDRQRGLAHQPARPVGLAHAPQAARGGDLVDAALQDGAGRGMSVHRDLSVGGFYHEPDAPSNPAERLAWRKARLAPMLASRTG